MGLLHVEDKYDWHWTLTCSLSMISIVSLTGLCSRRNSSTLWWPFFADKWIGVQPSALLHAGMQNNELLDQKNLFKNTLYM